MVCPPLHSSALWANLVVSQDGYTLGWRHALQTYISQAQTSSALLKTFPVQEQTYHFSAFLQPSPASPYTTQGRYTSQRASGQDALLPPLPPSRRRCAHRAVGVIPGRGPQPPSTRTHPSSSERQHRPAYATAAHTSLSRLRIQGIVRGVALNIIPPRKPRKSPLVSAPRAHAEHTPVRLPPLYPAKPVRCYGPLFITPRNPILATNGARISRCKVYLSHKQTWKLYHLFPLVPP